MANQAVYVFFLAEIEVPVSPSVTGMAGGARRPVAHHADAEIVHLVSLPYQHAFPVPDNIAARPRPMRCFHHIFGTVGVAFETSPCDYLRRINFVFEKSGMVEMWNLTFLERVHCL